MHKISIFLLLSLIFSINLVYGVCTINLDKESYNKGETAVVSMSCSEVTEKNKAYSLVWKNQTASGETLETDVGTTPNAVDEVFIDSYTIPSNYGSGAINATLTVNSIEKGFDNASVAGASANELIITDIVIAGKWLGLTTSVTSVVTDENSKKVSGGNCKVSLWNNDATQMVKEARTPVYNGELKAQFDLGYESFAEATAYKIKLICFCGSNSSVNECVDEDGTGITNSIGISTGAFTTNTWITINEDPMPIAYENGTDYPNSNIFAGFGERVFYRANITNYYEGSELELVIKTFLTNNDTGAIFLQPEQDVAVSLGDGNTSIVGRHEIISTVPTGIYFVTKFYDIYFNNILVSQGIVDTETFNITGTDESFKLENIVTDKSNYYTGEEVHICANITNNFNERIEFKVLYNFRCGSNNLDGDTDRALVNEHVELRALSADTTQNQCASLDIGFHDHMLYKTTQCYASVTIMSDYIATFDNKRSKTSPNFNVTDFGYYPRYEANPSYPIVELFPNWRRFDNLIDNVDKSYFRTKINISKLSEDYLDIDGVIVDNAWDIYAICTENMPVSTEHYNFTVLDKNGNTVDNEVEAKALQWRDEEGMERSRCAIGIENVNFSDTGDDWFEVRIWYEDFEERSTKALEGINSSAGVFDFSILVQDTVEHTALVAGSGLTGDGRTLNRDLNIKCMVDNNPQTLSEFKVFATSSFSFSKELKVPDQAGIYTMRCTAIDSFFGEDAVQATSNFEKTDPNSVSNPASPVSNEPEEEIEELVPTLIPHKKPPFGILSGILIALAAITLIVLVIIQDKDEKNTIFD